MLSPSIRVDSKVTVPFSVIAESSTAGFRIFLFIFVLLFCFSLKAQFLPIGFFKPTSDSEGGHYFVITAFDYYGDFGGLNFANAICLNELLKNDWMGKSNVDVRGTKVKAFLCDGSTCQNLQPSTQYTFAAAERPGKGGGTFTTDASGIGPNDSVSWDEDDRFGSGGGYIKKIWTGRAAGTGDQVWSNTPATKHCYDWTDQNGLIEKGGSGNLNSTTGTRWTANRNCYDAARIVCAVDDDGQPVGPDQTPAITSPTPVTGASLVEQVVATVPLADYDQSILVQANDESISQVRVAGGHWDKYAEVATSDALEVRVKASDAVSTNITAQFTAGTSNFSFSVTTQDPVSVTCGALDPTYSCANTTTQYISFGAGETPSSCQAKCVALQVVGCCHLFGTSCTFHPNITTRNDLSSGFESWKTGICQ